MGLFDDIHCDYPLPGNPPAFVAKQPDFQTKDLDCCMEHFTITTDGKLRRDSGPDDMGDFTGTVEFYTSNIVASGPGVYTRNGEDAESVGYRAVFVHGRVIELTEMER